MQTVCGAEGRHIPPGVPGRGVVCLQTLFLSGVHRRTISPAVPRWMPLRNRAVNDGR